MHLGFAKIQKVYGALKILVDLQESQDLGAKKNNKHETLKQIV